MSKFFGLILVLAVVAAILYFSLVEKNTPVTDEQAGKTTTETVTEETSPDMPPQPQPSDAAPTADNTGTPSEEETKPVIVETKKLEMPEAADTNEKPLTEEFVTADPAIAAMMADRTLGSPDAPVKVIEYSSLTCGHCASFHNEDLTKIKEAYVDTGKVQFIFREYPLNQPAVIASQILRCMPEDKFVNFMGLLFEQQQNWAYEADYKAKLVQYAKLAGLGEDKINACVDNIELKEAIIARMKTAGDKYKIASTPTFIVNDGAKVIVGHQPFAFFQSTFDGLLNGGKEETKTE